MTVEKKREEPSDDRTPASEAPTVCPVVGIGASAGGIEAFRKFFPKVEPDCGMAFVVVQHLDPDAKSILPELLSRLTRLEVRHAADEPVIEPNHVYVIPPNAALTIKDGRLHLSKPAQPAGHRTPIDLFLISLAQDRSENAACVILSGTGSDGTLGLKAIKEHGGLTLAQARESAEYDGMMRSAVATGLVDFVLPAEAMPAKLMEYFDHRRTIQIRKGADGLRQEATDYLAQICTLLRARTGHDFSNYKDKTVVRRVQRRMQVLQIDAVPEFVERLRKEPREVDLLFQDMLIGVTHFFRDPEAFDALEEKVIPRLFDGRGPDDTVRVWVPGCATGEEAYSIAMLLREQMPKARGTPKLQIFASDIDEPALDVARLGRYPATIEHDVSARRLQRFFLREDGTYRVIGELREMCLFAAHNLLRDAPFSKLDLISCRNLLIYLNSDLQDRIIPLFHYALRDEGFLLLGTSENVARHSRLFSVVDKPNRIFRRRLQLQRTLPQFPLSTTQAPRRQPAVVLRESTEATLVGRAERLILERLAPAYALINAEGEVMHFSGRTGKYLEPAPGAPEHNIFSMARPGLRMELRAVVHKAIASDRVVVRRNVTVDVNGGRQAIDLVVQPVSGSGDDESNAYLVAFQDIGGVKLETEPELADITADAEADNVRELEAELREARERLQLTTEELESSNEELKSANEELSSMNEELQSTNEELETSKEELQSINEELQTVNAELNARVEELSRANSDISNLLENTQIAALFLDRNLCIQSFTPAAKDLFHLVESDTGRPISHVRTRFGPDDIQEDAEKVLRTLGAVERQVEGSDSGARYIMRMLPYRTVDNVINGVVITFADVTRIAEAEARIDELNQDLQSRIAELEALLGLVPVGIFIAEDPRAQRIRTNRYGARIVGEEDDQEGLKRASALYRLFMGEQELPPEEQPLQRAAGTGEAVPSFEGRLLRPDGSAVEVMISATPLLDDAGEVRGAIAALVDITYRKKAEAQRNVLLHELQHRVKNILATVASLAARMIRTSDSLEDFSDTFLARLSAMGDVHELLSESQWEGAGLRDLIRIALAPYAASNQANVTLSGDDLMLKPGTAATMGMIFHELATNAVKYGALSAEGGRIAVSWTVSDADGDKRLSLAWTEQGGPPAKPPAKSGFGTTFITRTVDYELQGEVELTFGDEGLRCVLGFPLLDNGVFGPVA